MKDWSSVFNELSLASFWQLRFNIVNINEHLCFDQNYLAYESLLYPSISWHWLCLLYEYDMISLVNVLMQFLKINYPETKHKPKKHNSKISFYQCMYIYDYSDMWVNIKTRFQNTSALITQKCLYSLFKYFYIFLCF